MNPAEIREKVHATLVEALNVDEDELRPDATLQGDLGAESIDFLDIVFRLEREFGLKIPRGELFPEQIFWGDPEYVQNGTVNAKGIKMLREQTMPWAQAAITAFEKNPEMSSLWKLFTVETVVEYITRRLNADTPVIRRNLGSEHM
jgi:acyl carrier protein